MAQGATEAQENNQLNLTAMKLISNKKYNLISSQAVLIESMSKINDDGRGVIIRLNERLHKYTDQYAILSEALDVSEKELDKWRQWAMQEQEAKEGLEINLAKASNCARVVTQENAELGSQLVEKILELTRLTDERIKRDAEQQQQQHFGFEFPFKIPEHITLPNANTNPVINKDLVDWKANQKPKLIAVIGNIDDCNTMVRNANNKHNCKYLILNKITTEVERELENLIIDELIIAYTESEKHLYANLLKLVQKRLK